MPQKLLHDVAHVLLPEAFEQQNTEKVGWSQFIEQTPEDNFLVRSVLSPKRQLTQTGANQWGKCGRSLHQPANLPLDPRLVLSDAPAAPAPTPELADAREGRRGKLHVLGGNKMFELQTGVLIFDLV